MRRGTLTICYFIQAPTSAHELHAPWHAPCARCASAAQVHGGSAPCMGLPLLDVCAAQVCVVVVTIPSSTYRPDILVETYFSEKVSPTLRSNLTRAPHHFTRLDHHDTVPVSVALSMILPFIAFCTSSRDAPGAISSRVLSAYSLKVQEVPDLDGPV